MNSIKLKLASGSVVLLTGVRFIPQIKRNLVSLGVLQSKGYGFRSQDDQMEIYFGNAVVMNAMKKQTLYYLDAEVVAGNSYSIESGVSDFELWHSRLAHLGQKA